MDKKTNLSIMAIRRLKAIIPWTTSLFSLPILGRRRSRSIFIRHVDCGSSNACEQEITSLFNPVYDLGRFGFELVASPRHADILLLTGPLTRAMCEPLVAAFRAMPEPKHVVTVGNGFEETNVFYRSYAVMHLPDEIMNALIAHIPGDPPTPEVMLEYLLALQFY